jgi:hypothetical protein
VVAKIGAKCSNFSNPRGLESMFKTLAVLAALAVAVPTLALAQGNSHNTPAAQNANGVPFTANDPPANTFNSAPTLPVVLGPGSVPPGCNVLALDKDDRNGQNGDDKKSSPGNPNCQPASP